MAKKMLEKLCCDSTYDVLLKGNFNKWYILFVKKYNILDVYSLVIFLFSFEPLFQKGVLNTT